MVRKASRPTPEEQGCSHRQYIEGVGLLIVGKKNSDLKAVIHSGHGGRDGS
jgi:hypothetical protein